MLRLMTDSTLELVCLVLARLVDFAVTSITFLILKPFHCPDRPRLIFMATTVHRIERLELGPAVEPQSNFAVCFFRI